MTVGREEQKKEKDSGIGADKGYPGLELRIENLGAFGRDWIQVERQKDLQSTGLLRFKSAVLRTIGNFRRIFTRRTNPDGSRSCFCGKGALIDPACIAHETALVCEGAYVGRGAKLGVRAVVGVGAQIEPGVEIGNDIEIKAGEIVKESRRFNPNKTVRPRTLMEEFAAASLRGGVVIPFDPPYGRADRGRKEKSGRE